MHTDLDQVAEALDTVFAAWTVPIGVYPNSGTFTPPQWVFGDVSPDRLAAAALTWAGRGVQIIGGC
jgi:S-methylmethionine-dependent homocysteine/selenocysteine methylase